MMVTCRLLCALLVLALCCCPSVFATETLTSVVEGDHPGEHSGPTKPKSEVANQVMQLHSTTPLPPKVSEGEIRTAESQGDLNQEQEEKPTIDEADRGETDNAKEQNQKTNAINTTTTTTTATELPEDKKKPDAQANAGTTNQLTLAPVGKSPGADHSGSLGSGSGGDSGKIDEGGQGLTNLGKKPNNSTNELQKETNKVMTGSKNGTSQSTDQTDSNAKDPAATTTTTTQARSDKATTTITTEAPTTTTTRAPSRLREIDGSLSSSVWVCAPLLLAASALAYTTVG
ncbi:mucin TcMUCII [Trypanosoma cruzi Dm28c]|uniref:Mucin TcMUCII n=2 Tax=Trypanosoma cruzi TaxID=5693 RepID=V5BDY7_TRYCR|nr:mucin TcMUCII [Trypanosoma cruzi Dm28c]PBJ68770.1 mucin TcMUCII [Trypanosoma cruzi cruzi]PWV01056.1 putative mucin TcMUCII [Trypanosoma cruzi]